ncbi:glutathione S-transferase [Shewanella sp. ENK2]|uniref:glutathione S-transferase n=1 Tax=Shewanella sp. ENK2 TaxID=2775245 RepID=UPI00374A174D
MILYSFRRCPYAMRARLGLHLSALNPDVREIELRNKPEAMLAVSPKGTVPVLVINAHHDVSAGESEDKSTNRAENILEESLDIARFSLSNYPDKCSEYLCGNAYISLLESLDDESTEKLISKNDIEFKPWLDKYKYADRHPEFDEIYYRDRACEFIQCLEEHLTDKNQLMADTPTFADFAIFPFIRQFAHVNKPWFEQSPYQHVRRWLTAHMESELFKAVMVKYPLWLDDTNKQTRLKSDS